MTRAGPWGGHVTSERCPGETWLRYSSSALPHPTVCPWDTPAELGCRRSPRGLPGHVDLREEGAWVMEDHVEPSRPNSQDCLLRQSALSRGQTVVVEPLLIWGSLLLAAKPHLNGYKHLLCIRTPWELRGCQNEQVRGCSCAWRACRLVGEREKPRSQTYKLINKCW